MSQADNLAALGSNVNTSGVLQPAGGGTGTTTSTGTGSVVLSSGATLTNATINGAVASGFTMKNRIINGAMMIDQRNAGASVTPASGAYSIDRWKCYLSQSSKYTIQQNAGSVTPPAGFTNYLGVTSSSAYSVLTGDYFFIAQFVEGLNLADLGWGTANAQTVTLSFWVRSSLTGTFGGSIVNGGSNRSYPFTYTISSANTWEQKTVTITGDTSGTWLTTNGIGCQVIFSLGAGATFSGTASAWAGANYTSATGATSVVGTNGATFYITGVQLERGSAATSFEWRPYGTELQLCQRYLPAGPYNGATYPGQATSTSTNLFTVPFQVTPRVAPTGVTVNSPTLWGTTNSTGAGIAASTVTFSGASLVAGSLIVTLPSASLVAGNASVAYASSAIAFFTGCEL